MGLCVERSQNTARAAHYPDLVPTRFGRVNTTNPGWKDPRYASVALLSAGRLHKRLVRQCHANHRHWR